jgi:hypothetical protein
LRKNFRRRIPPAQRSRIFHSSIVVCDGVEADQEWGLGKNRMTGENLEAPLILDPSPPGEGEATFRRRGHF